MDVRIETVAAPVLFLPGPNADKAIDALRTLRDTADGALSAMRYTPEEVINVIRLEVIAEALDEATRPMRRAERDHMRAYAAEVHARQFHVDTGPDTSTDTSTDTQGTHDGTTPESES